MRKFKTYKTNKNTIWKEILIVFFCALICALILFNWYAFKIKDNIGILINAKVDKVVDQFFSDLITDDIINNESVKDILVVTKNDQGDILTVNYDLEKTYAILTLISNILKKGLSDLENGQIDVTIYDKYLDSKGNGLILYVPFFLTSQNIFLYNLGPKIPVLIDLNESLLTNVKTKVTNYGFNNALLEIYVTVEIDKLIITPMHKQTQKLNYDILIASLVINGRVPEFYGDSFEAFSNAFILPNKI